MAERKKEKERYWRQFSVSFFRKGEETKPIELYCEKNVCDHEKSNGLDVKFVQIEESAYLYLIGTPDNFLFENFFRIPH